MATYIIRHGQGTHNIKDDFNIFDPELTPLGVDQCRTASPPSVATVVASTSTRTIQTAMNMFPRHKILATHLAREPNTGVACNSTRQIDELAVSFPDVDFETLKVDTLAAEYRWEECIERAHKLMAQVKDLPRPLAIVTHCNFMRSILAVNGKDHHVDIDNCDIFEL